MSYQLLKQNILKANLKYNIFTSIRNDLPESKENLPLSGLLSAIKDNILTTDEATTCSSKMLQDYKSPFASTVTNLLELNGARIVGKTNLDEFGMGSACTHSVFGSTKNPLFTNEERVAGGSSGGSAAAVAADLVDFSIGTDTGGSVRLPAAYCGIIGFKPTYGRISRWGVIAYSQALDTIGILAKNIPTVRKVYKVLDKFDDQDPTSMKVDLRESFKSVKSLSPTIRFAIVDELNLQEMSSESLQAWSSILKHIISEGHEVVRLSLPIIKSALPAYYTLVPSEASSNLARYDGIRYGHRSESSDSLDGLQFAPTRTEGFGTEVQRRILMGTYNLSSEAYNTHFMKAQQVRQVLNLEFDKVFRSMNTDTDEGVDFIISPTSMTIAPTVESITKGNDENPINSYVNDVLTVPASLSGLPAISIPWTAEGAKIPIGIQICGQFGDDEALLNIAETLLNH